MKIFLFHVLICLSFCANAQYRGTVFEDTNRNGQPDPGEGMLSNIRVSDGLHVKLTDQSGAFLLPGYKKSRFLFITVPAGYRSVQKHYLAVKGNDSTYNFGIIPDPNTGGDHVKMLQISDTETDIYGDWIANIRRFSSEHEAAFIVHTGDICYEKGLRFHAAQVNSESMQKPIHYAMGNHDLVKGAYGEELFESLFGPPYYSFDAGPAHFIVTPMAGGDFKPDYTTDQLIAWMKNDLALTDKNRPVFIFNHNLPFVKGQFLLKGAKDSIDLEKAGLKAWVYGHWHSDYVTQERNGIYTICTGPLNKGGIDNSPGQFLSIDIDARGIKRIEPYYAYLKEHIAIVQPSGSSMNVLQNGKLAINTVIYDSESIVKGATAQIYDASGVLIKTQKLKASSWNWRTIIPAQWKPGRYHILVEAVYSNGKSAIRRQEFVLGQQAVKQPLNLKWSTTLPGSVWKSVPLVKDDMVYVATVDDAANRQSGVTALSTASGEKIWSYTTQNSVKQALAYNDGVLVATDMEGWVYAFEPKTGTLMWRKDLGINSLPGNLTGGVASEGVYYTGNGKYLQAIRIKTGETIWKNSDWDVREGSPAQLTLAGQVLISGNNWSGLYANDIKTGKLLWKRDDEGLRFRSGKATYSNHLVYINGNDALFILDPQTGKTVKKILTPYDLKVTAAPVVTDGLIIIATGASGIVAYSKNTLQKKWHRTVEEALVYTVPYHSPDRLLPIQTVEATPLAYDQRLIFGASDGNLYVIDERSGTVEQRLQLGIPVFADATIHGNRCYVADFGGNIYCYSIN